MTIWLCPILFLLPAPHGSEAYRGTQSQLNISRQWFCPGSWSGYRSCAPRACKEPCCCFFTQRTGSKDILNALAQNEACRFLFSAIFRLLPSSLIACWKGVGEREKEERTALEMGERQLNMCRWMTPSPQVSEWMRYVMLSKREDEKKRCAPALCIKIEAWNFFSMGHRDITD